MAGEGLTSSWVKSENEDAEKVEKLGMQRRGHRHSIADAERQWAEDTFMSLFSISSDRHC